METLEESPSRSVEPQTTDAPEPRKRLIPGGAGGPTFWIVLTVAVAVAVLTPVIPLQVIAWENGADAFRRLAEVNNIGQVLWTTLILGVGGLVVGLTMGTVLALCVYSMTPRLRKVVEFLPVIPMVIPGVAHVIGFVFLFSPENGYINTILRWTPFFSGDTGPVNVYSLPWIVFYTGTHLAAFVFLFVYTGLRNLGADYGLAARVNGAGGLRTVLTITLPMLRPTFVYASVVVLLLSLGQFTGPLILGRREGIDIITTEIYELSAEVPVDYALASAFGTPLLILAIVLVLVQRKMLGNQNRFVGQGTAVRDNRVLQRSVSWMATVVVGAYVLVAAVLPLLALCFVALSPFWSGLIDFSGLTLANFTEVIGDDRLHEAIVTTLIVSILGVVLVLPIGMLVAMGVYNKDKLWKPLPAILDLLVNLPLTVPAALLGLGFLFAFTDPAIGIYGTRASLVLAFMTIMIPYAVRYQLATLVAIGRQTTEASQVSGAGPFRTFFQVILPLSKTGIVSSAAIMFVLLSHEFGVALLLRAPGTSVMSVVLYDQYISGSYPTVAVIALIMTLITAIGVATAMAFGGRKALQNL